MPETTPLSKVTLSREHTRHSIQPLLDAIAPNTSDWQSNFFERKFINTIHLETMDLSCDWNGELLKAVTDITRFLTNQPCSEELSLYIENFLKAVPSYYTEKPNLNIVLLVDCDVRFNLPKATLAASKIMRWMLSALLCRAVSQLTDSEKKTYFAQTDMRFTDIKSMHVWIQQYQKNQLAFTFQNEITFAVWGVSSIQSDRVTKLRIVDEEFRRKVVFWKEIVTLGRSTFTQFSKVIKPLFLSNIQYREKQLFLYLNSYSHALLHGFLSSTHLALVAAKRLSWGESAMQMQYDIAYRLSRWWKFCKPKTKKMGVFGAASLLAVSGLSYVSWLSAGFLMVCGLAIVLPGLVWCMNLASIALSNARVESKNPICDIIIMHFSRAFGKTFANATVNMPMMMDLIQCHIDTHKMDDILTKYEVIYIRAGMLKALGAMHHYGLFKLEGPYDEHIFGQPDKGGVTAPITEEAFDQRWRLSVDAVFTPGFAYLNEGHHQSQTPPAQTQNAQAPRLHFL